jgi:hypothetical protein
MGFYRSRASKRAALLASTAMIALLSACQATSNGNDSGSSTSGNGQQEYHYGWYGYAW